eukprot:CAMPEP_0170516904 /NCGR_PEP_ID=MMETSP0209-20121228/3029_1 /TAXON_ID=665100 ORGANISM="Litonotus pictus, Strain P1" /NCGR_SAMPLE_ID=MMETSP0209 /ASSEMBLY_ACC=CAM_ASM_000301 /LENGTH=158 /DNA_ID=CAMNT_0010801997 /DNA_START=158 /DNA_END=630 /DNA_ORIENTATION=+
MEIENKKVLLNVWDTAGEEKYHALAPNYYRDANGALLVFDLTKIESFNLIEKWIYEIKSVVPELFQIVICANKFDLVSFWQVKEEEIKALADKYDAEYVLVSAKEDKNIIESFNLLAGKIVSDQTVGNSGKKRRRTVKVDKKNMSLVNSQIETKKDKG